MTFGNVGRIKFESKLLRLKERLRLRVVRVGVDKVRRFVEYVAVQVLHVRVGCVRTAPRIGLAAVRLILAQAVLKHLLLMLVVVNESLR